MLNAAPPINEAVALLHKFAPESLARLQSEIPELRDHLIPGGVAGPADPQVIARAKVCLRTLDEVMTLCNRGIAHAQGRLSRQKKLTLIGGATSAVASASVVVSLAASYSSFAFCAGVISLGGSLAALVAEHVGKVPKSGMSLFDAYEQLVTIRADAYLLSNELKAHLDDAPKSEQEEEIARLVGQGNASFRKTHEIFSVLELAFTE